MSFDDGNLRTAVRDLQLEIERLKAERVEVVRCRDCKHYEPEWTSEVHPEWHWCDECGFYRKPDGFCAWGERHD